MSLVRVETVDGRANIEAVEAIMRRGGDWLRTTMAAIESHLDEVTMAAGAPLAAHANATVAAGGKRLRPLLVVLASHASGAEDQIGLVRAAVAVELVHSATLVHDDVIDGATVRRGVPTVAQVGGRETAIATGDMLFASAFAELARNGDPEQLRALSEASSALAIGELLQREDSYALDVTVERYLRRCELKTAALFEAACRLGALTAQKEGARGGEGSRGAQGAESEPGRESVRGAEDAPGRASVRGGEGAPGLADGLGVFARRIGLAFQLLDDVLDVSGTVQDTGKPRGADLLDGTVTLPLILARERDSELAALDLAGLRGPEEAEAVCERIAATGALEEARERALAFVAEAKAGLREVLRSPRSELLDLVADAVVERYR